MSSLNTLSRDLVRFIRHAIWEMMRAALIAMIIGIIVAEVAGFFLVKGWPNGLFVHIATAAFAITLGYAAGVTAALVELIRGLAAASTRIDDVVKDVLSGGVNVIDAVVDAVDGPNRHGIK
ncbi:MAG TPA: hypothetical protein VF040_19230 [Ktedonobacterales bacterium]